MLLFKSPTSSSDRRLRTPIVRIVFIWPQNRRPLVASIFLFLNHTYATYNIKPLTTHIYPSCDPNILRINPTSGPDDKFMAYSNKQRVPGRLTPIGWRSSANRWMVTNCIFFFSLNGYVGHALHSHR